MTSAQTAPPDATPDETLNGDDALANPDGTTTNGDDEANGDAPTDPPTDEPPPTAAEDFAKNTASDIDADVIQKTAEDVQANLRGY